ncbi:MAG: transposase [Thermoleophilia bacterium]
MTTKNTRRRFSAKLKFQIVLEAIRGERPAAEIARQYQINPNLIGRWKNEFLQNGHELFDSPTADNSKEKKIEQLEKLIGKQTIEIELLKNFLGHYA